MTDEHGEWQEMRLAIDRQGMKEPAFQAKEYDLDTESYREHSTICFFSFWNSNFAKQ